MTDMRAEPAPELAILLVADSLAMLRKVLRFYAAQCDDGRLELVVARVGGADISEIALREEGFACVRVVDGGDGELAVAEARAVHAATAPLVVFAQAHAYPRPGYVRAILAAARAGRWSVIGPSMDNANPVSALSSAAMRIGYGAWWGGDARGTADTVPGHSSAYDRGALVALGTDLEKVLTAGRQLQLDLQARGGEILYEPAACVEIVNISRMLPFLADQFRQGRVVAGERSLRWSRTRRATYAIGSPLIPLVRLVRILAGAPRLGKPAPRVIELLALVAGLVASATGELVGYLFGKSPHTTSHELSFHRLRYVRDADRRWDADETLWPPPRPARDA